MANNKAYILFTLMTALALSNVAAAQTPSWTFDKYVGTTQWQVDLTEDETGCGATELKYESYGVTIQHNLQIADVSSWGHGGARGSFSGNVLSIPGRTIPDGAGESKLYAVDLAFTPDCLGFQGSYRWDYKDSNMQCSGTTTLKGKRSGSIECPGVQETQEQARDIILKAREEFDTIQKEKMYQQILDKDPTNFWANWDLAELKKKQGNYNDFFKHFDKAVSNEKIFQDTREKLKEEAANRLRLSELPTKGKSPILRIETGELDNWDGKFLNKITVPKEPTKAKWYFKIWNLFKPNSYKLVNDAIGLPQDE